MVNNHSIYAYCLRCTILFVSLSGCSVDIDNYQLPYEGDRMILNGGLSPNGVLLEIRHTQNPNELIALEDSDTVNHAMVWLLNSNGQPLSPLAYRGYGQYFLDTLLATEDTYRISAVANGFPDVITEPLKIPPPPIWPDNIHLTARTESFGLVYDITIDLQDEAFQENIYLAAPLPVEQGTDKPGFLYTGLDDDYQSQCGILDDEGWVFWKDNCFNGQKTSLVFVLSFSSTNPMDSVGFHFGTTSSSFYNYVDREDQPDGGIEQTFGQPRPQATNIIGGFGIIATWNTRIFWAKL